MWEELIKLKETIANMLNLIQEEASQDLFTKVTDCIIWFYYQSMISIILSGWCIEIDK